MKTKSTNREDICAVISGGEYAPMTGIEECKYVIACDKGFEYALREHITPDVILGDFDSYRGELPTEIEILRLPVEKDDTDTMSAVRYALELGYKRIRIYCALGGRLDHLYANVQTAAYAAAHGARAAILGADTEIHVFTNGALTLPARKGMSLSVFSVTDEARGVSIRGTKYTLDNAVITNSFPIGASNEWHADFAEVEVKEGIIAVMLCRMPSE